MSKHHAIVRSTLKGFSGREVDTAGDGFFAVFDSPGDAIRCAAVISDAVREIGLEVRCGLHAGEVEIDGPRARGIAVVIAARVMAAGGAGDVLVSGSFHDAVAGSSLVFGDLGDHELKGVSHPVRLTRLLSVDGAELTAPLDPSTAQQRRAAAADASERSTGRPLALGSILTVVVIAAIGVMVASASRHDTPAPAPEGRDEATTVLGAAVQIDPETGHVVGSIPHVVSAGTRQYPQLDVGEGGVWVLNDGVLVDVEDHAEPGVPIGPAGGKMVLELGFRTVWTGTSNGDVTPVDPSTMDLLRPIR